MCIFLGSGLNTYENLCIRWDIFRLTTPPREEKFHLFSNDMKFHETLKTKFHNISQNFTIFHKISQTKATLRKLSLRTFAVLYFEKSYLNLTDLSFSRRRFGLLMISELSRSEYWILWKIHCFFPVKKRNT